MASRTIEQSVANDRAPPLAPGAAMETAPPLSRLLRVSYGVGAIANGVKNVSFSAYLMFFYNQVVGVPAAIVAAALALTLVIDAIADPFLGRWSDITRTRWGRRHPFIYVSAVPTALFFVLVWMPPNGLSPVQIGMWVFVTAMLTRVSISAFEINTQAMTAELTDDYGERTRLFSLRYWFLYMGQYGFSAIALLVFFAATPEFPRGQLNPDSYVGFAWLGGGMILFSMLACGLGTHERIPYLRQAESRAGRIPAKTHFREMFTAFRNRAFLAIFGFGVFKFTAIGLYAATALYFNTYLFGLTSAQLALLTLDSVVAASLAAPLAPVMSRRLGKRTSSMLFALAGVALSLSPLVLAYLDLFFARGDPRLLPTLFAIGAIYGAMVAISLINTSSMLADVVEDSAVRTGRYEAGTFFAAASFMQQCSTAIGLAVNGVILTWASFPAKVKIDQVSDAMLDSLIIHYVPVSFGLWAIGCAMLVFYPIDRARHESNVEALKSKRHAAGSSHRPLK
ncbi:MFS transporter [Sphingomonas sp. IC4-52]|uniref:MFS transporter n=1 Tax=Sphingomonas sp. IC4-52 TaxID=2887202 RepID=UPI001D12D644|nr:MFS transporter [Sphingomonas sp. IC4-52]MCC2980984.1 MFS transporter [Sphingomonas sp. IC4-52]